MVTQSKKSDGKEVSGLTRVHSSIRFYFNCFDNIKGINFIRTRFYYLPVTLLIYIEKESLSCPE